MHFSNCRRLAVGFLALFHFVVSIFSLTPVSTWAQAVDAEPPVVDFQAVSQGVKGDGQVFTATVTDNVNLVSVLLHFRLDGESLYEIREMKPLGNTDIYTTTIETSDAIEAVDGIQYYIEAVDAAGNRTLEGFAFDPIERALIDRQVAAPENTAQSSSTSAESTIGSGMSTGRKVLYGLLGVIVVGALASSSGGGGGSSQQGVDVTVVVDPLP